MYWLYWVFISIVTLASFIVGIAFITALRTENPVGFQVGFTTDSKGQHFPIGIFYPTKAQTYPTTLVGTVLLSVARDAPVTGSNLPLIVFSHGNGGGVQSHADLALALASAGYIVAIPQHTGDNFSDQSEFGTESWLHQRSDEYHASVDYMLNDWSGHKQIDPARIGAFGFSAGGFTVLTAIGAQPDLGSIAKHCAESPEFVCDLLQQVNSPLLHDNLLASNTVFSSDPRIRSAVIAAPGLVFTMAPNGLNNINIPVQLWHGDKDNNVPYDTNIQPILNALGPKVEFHSVVGAGHFSFLIPCGLFSPPQICSEQGGFDRKSFHTDMNARVINFFEKNMGKP
jgi:predicted dienelactone hydrolase